MSEFMGRIWLGLDSVEEIETWCYELEPVDRGKRGIAEWGREYLNEGCSQEDLRQIFNLESGCHQILFKADISGHRDYWGEYDEGFEILEHSSIKLPDNWFEETLELGPDPL